MHESENNPLNASVKRIDQRSKANDTPAGEFLWTDKDFKRIQNLIYQKAGISLHDGKHAMVYSRLSRRLRETSFSSFQEYLNYLEGGGDAEWQEFINALTTNLTAFFREQHHFEALRGYLSAWSSSQPCRIWCSAASTGEEPYSIWITAAETLGHEKSLLISASDIDSRVLETAKNGVYRSEQVKEMSATRLKRFFLRGAGKNSGLVRIKPEISAAIDFTMVNLIGENWPFRESFDFIFCRNVMIYFDPPTQRKVLEKIHRILSPGGILFVGHAENFSESRDLFSLRGKTIYERV